MASSCPRNAILWIDRCGKILGQAAAWMYFVTGGMILWEVIGRYLFAAPTIWAEELSRLLLLWGTYLAMASVLRQRQMIRITMVLDILRPGLRATAELFSLLFIAGICGVAIWYGWEIAADSFVRGRTTGTLLNIPNWWSEAVIPFGFLLLLLQCLSEIAKTLPRSGPQPQDGDAGAPQ